MKKIIIATALVSAVGLVDAQQGYVPEYVEDVYRTNDNSALSGTARFRGMSGAMGALGGDLSATGVNPAGTAVFLKSEGAISVGINSQRNEVNFGGSSAETQKTTFDLSQAGAVLVFDDLNSEDWRNVAVGINYQRTTGLSDDFSIPRNENLTDTAGNVFNGYTVESEGEANELNLNFAANYQDKLFLGVGVNFNSYIREGYEVYNEANTDGNNYTYVKDGAPYYKEGNGISLSAGIIAKINQKLRLGASYKSPTWWNDVLLDEFGYFVQGDTDDLGDFFFVDRELFTAIYDQTSHHQVTGSAAIVFGAGGLISADVIYKDYSPANMRPELDFAPENQYIDDYMSSSLAFRLGTEFRIQDWRLRGGYRFEQSPFEEISLDGVDGNYQPFGDLQGYSLGLGYDFKSFYFDFAYDFFKRDRNYLLTGSHADYLASVDADANTTIDDAVNILSLNFADEGISTSVRDITERQGNFTLSVGFRF